MHTTAEFIIVAVILLNLALAASGSLAACIRLAAAQGVIAAALPLLAVRGLPAGRALIFSVSVMLLKGAVFPWLLNRARVKAGVRRDVEPLIGYAASILLCLGAFAASAWMGTRLPLPEAGRVAWIVPASLATIFTGFLLIITRSKAITQVLGYLVIENGIYIFGLALFVEQPLMVELAILLDVFVAVFVMGITIFHISREFDHIDTSELSELSDWYPQKGGGSR
jgi:hydrogenase-4 component E